MRLCMPAMLMGISEPLITTKTRHTHCGMADMMTLILRSSVLGQSLCTTRIEGNLTHQAIMVCSLASVSTHTAYTSGTRKAQASLSGSLEPISVSLSMSVSAENLSVCQPRTLNCYRMRSSSWMETRIWRTPVGHFLIWSLIVCQQSSCCTGTISRSLFRLTV